MNFPGVGSIKFYLILSYLKDKERCSERGIRKRHEMEPKTKEEKVAQGG